MDFPYLLIFTDLGQKRGALTLLGDRWARRALLKPVVLQFSTGYQLHLSVHSDPQRKERNTLVWTFYASHLKGILFYKGKRETWKPSDSIMLSWG